MPYSTLKICEIYYLILLEILTTEDCVILWVLYVSNATEGLNSYYSSVIPPY